MIAWRESLDLVCRTRGTCLRWFTFDSSGRCWGGTCVRGCGGSDCQWLVRPTLQRFARGTTPPERDGVDLLARTKPFVPVEAPPLGEPPAVVEPLPLPDPPSGPVRVR